MYIQEIKNKVQRVFDLHQCTTTVSDEDATAMACDLEKVLGSRLLLNATDIAKKNASDVTLVVITKLGAHHPYGQTEDDQSAEKEST